MDSHHYKLNKKAFLNYLMLAEPQHMWLWYVDAYVIHNHIKDIKKEFPKAYDLIIGTANNPSGVVSTLYSRERLSLGDAKKVVSNDKRGEPSMGAVKIVQSMKNKNGVTIQLKNTIRWAMKIIENDPNPFKKSESAMKMRILNFVHARWAIDIIVSAAISEETQETEFEYELSPFGVLFDLYDRKSITSSQFAKAKEKILVNRNAATVTIK